MRNYQEKISFSDFLEIMSNFYSAQINWYSSAQINWYVRSQRISLVLGSGSTPLEQLSEKPRHLPPFESEKWGFMGKIAGRRRIAPILTLLQWPVHTYEQGPLHKSSVSI